MKDLSYYQEIIQNRRKQTSFRDFLMEIASWKPYGFYKVEGNISRYPNSDRNLNTVSTKEFSDTRDALLDYGREYDASKSFFENFKGLMQAVPHAHLTVFYENENCDFSDCSFGAKNSYLSTTIGLNSKNAFYSAFCYSNVTNIFNSFFVTESTDNVYFSSTVGTNSYNVFYSKYISQSSNIWFSSNLIGCRECILCDGLENQSYCIENIVYDKQEYLEKKKEILENKQSFLGLYKKVNKTAINYSSRNCKGNALYFCEDVTDSYFFVRLKNGHNVMVGDGLNGCESFYDCFDVGANSSHLYGCLCGDNFRNSYLSSDIANSSSIFYSYMMESCSHCIGCIGLRNKSYCIFNQQYSKQEWEALADKIFSQMEQDGVLGDFFPGNLNPFYFNDTMAGLFGDFSKQEIIKKGYMWRDEEIRVDIPEASKVIQAGELDQYQGYDEDGNWKINPEVLRKVVVDEKGNYYRIVQMEYDFLMKHALPLPEIHWMDRMRLNFGI